MQRDDRGLLWGRFSWLGGGGAGSLGRVALEKRGSVGGRVQMLQRDHGGPFIPCFRLWTLFLRTHNGLDRFVSWRDYSAAALRRDQGRMMSKYFMSNTRSPPQ